MMSNKLVKVLAWIPIINFMLIIYYIINGFVLKKVKDAVIATFVFAIVMIVFAIFRSILVVAFSAWELYYVIKVFTYVSLYVSFAMVSFIFYKGRIVDNIDSDNY